MLKFQKERELAVSFFMNLRDMICASYEKIEQDFAEKYNLTAKKFTRKDWDRPGGGYGQAQMILGGCVFEKVGVNFSEVHGELSEAFRKEIPYTENNPNFFATGISLVSHPLSPYVPAVHMNLRFIFTEQCWFGGGADLTPTMADASEAVKFHGALKNACDRYSPEYYDQFKDACDKYFFLKHRNEARGIGGIFFDYLNTDFDANFKFVQDVGLEFYNVYPEIVVNKLDITWDTADKQKQLMKRARYAEFNLLYDRGVKFGLMTNGNVDAIFMSMPPQVAWV